MQLSGILSGPKSEVEAVDAVQNMGRLARARMAWKAGISLALNTKDTQQVFYLAIALDRDTLPRLLSRMQEHPAGRELLHARPAIDSHSVDYSRLRSLPADTLGGAYARALQAQGLDPDIFQPSPGLPEDLTYITQRIKQTHDLWHVLTGLPTDIPGEVALQAFSYAQLHQRFSAAITSFGLLFFGLRYPRMWRMVARARRAGEAASFLLAVRWEDLWAEPLARVREQLGVADLTPA
ncbi:MAG TPA: Coq4 family protein [Polyangiales bacterium]|nr:Coq4 family protein [Polyangiales bacterium]